MDWCLFNIRLRCAVGVRPSELRFSFGCTPRKNEKATQAMGDGTPSCSGCDGSWWSSRRSQFVCYGKISFLGIHFEKDDITVWLEEILSYLFKSTWWQRRIIHCVVRMTEVFIYFPFVIKKNISKRTDLWRKGKGSKWVRHPLNCTVSSIYDSDLPINTKL